MREIKFRGQSKLNGKWAYGSLIPRGDDWCCIIVNSPEYGDLDNNEVRVITETTGQYTGLKDKNGKEIYEGDIIDDGFGNLFTIEWFQDHCQFLAARYGDDQEIGDWCIVIGNIYENKELLKSYK